MIAPTGAGEITTWVLLVVVVSSRSKGVLVMPSTQIWRPFPFVALGWFTTVLLGVK